MNISKVTSKQFMLLVLLFAIIFYGAGIIFSAESSGKSFIYLAGDMSAEGMIRAIVDDRINWRAKVNKEMFFGKHRHRGTLLDAMLNIGTFVFLFIGIYRSF